MSGQKNVRVGYLDQHSVLKKGMTIKRLASAFDYLYDMESRITDLYMSMADVDEETMVLIWRKLAHLRNSLTRMISMIDTKVSEVARALGCDLGLDTRVLSELSGGQRTKGSSW